MATWLFLGPLAALNFQIWQAFIAWASFFHCGGKTDGLMKTVVIAPMPQGAATRARMAAISGPEISWRLISRTGW